MALFLDEHASHDAAQRVRSFSPEQLKGSLSAALALRAGHVIAAVSRLTALRLPNALALALFGGIADAVPIIGSYLWIIPSALAALSVSPTAAVVVVVVLVAYQEIESRVIVQRVYGQTLHLPPSVVVVALLVGAELEGMVGALLALPTAAPFVC